ncbi:hypothetical protein HMPREF3038_00366 [Akkermansia sp. KLE1797]|nr:hypothetical protein HMPREF3038_00366 [Akkermansia sp. KLE1797]KXU55040.1 hypothetical protein HMPREF3039_00765 [Akkermansia sp. KLE1798]KZA04328.1 hypothetical protein HMPREF1326_01996 [Akkermansia sp. KLE1605]
MRRTFPPHAGILIEHTKREPVKNAINAHIIFIINSIVVL